MESPFIEEFIKAHKEDLVRHSKKYVSEREFVKIYIAGNEVLSSLKNSTKILFSFVFAQIQNRGSYNKDEIGFSYSLYEKFSREQDIKPISKRSFFYSRDELIQKRILAKTEIEGQYFFNINYFFNGDRMHIVNTYIKCNPKLLDIVSNECDLKSNSQDIGDPDLPESFKCVPVSVQKKTIDKDDWEETMRIAKEAKKKSAFSV